MATRQYLDFTGLSQFWSKVQTYIDSNIRANVYDDTELSAAVESNLAAIDILNGEGEGSVKKTVADEIAKVVAKAPAEFDTLKEIADFITNDITGASGLMNQVSSNTDAIESLETVTAVINTDGDGNSFLANNGIYKAIEQAKNAESAQTAVKAEHDSAGNKIIDTYATKEEIAELNINVVAVDTTSIDDVTDYITREEFNQALSNINSMLEMILGTEIV